MEREPDSSLKPWLYAAAGGFGLLALPYVASSKGWMVAWIPLLLAFLLFRAARSDHADHRRRWIRRFLMGLTILIWIAILGSSLFVLQQTWFF